MRYFFTLHDDMISIDTEGADLADAEEARRYATVAARDLMAAQIRDGSIDLSNWIGITDAVDIEIARIRFGDVVRIEGGDGVTG